VNRIKEVLIKQINNHSEVLEEAELSLKTIVILLFSKNLLSKIPKKITNSITLLTTLFKKEMIGLSRMMMTISRRRIQLPSKMKAKIKVIMKSKRSKRTLLLMSKTQIMLQILSLNSVSI